MERKTFLATAAGIGASIAAASAALSAPVPAPVGATPTPAGTMRPKTFHRNAMGSNRNIREIRKHLEHVIDELQHDQHDYAGHRVKALDLLNQARQELLLAEQSDTGK